MDWTEVRKHNARASARKAKRENNKAQFAARVEAAGGLITVAELKGASRRIEPPACGYCHDREVWSFRGQDWVLSYSDGEQWQSMAPFKSYRQDPELRESIPLTPGAKKWITKTLAAEYAKEIADAQS